MHYSSQCRRMISAAVRSQARLSTLGPGHDRMWWDCETLEQEKQPARKPANFVALFQKY